VSIKKSEEAGCGDTHLYFQLLGRWRQKDQEFEASSGKVSETLSQKQNINKGWGYNSSGRMLA
jgi:hypothetical protein